MKFLRNYFHRSEYSFFFFFFFIISLLEKVFFRYNSSHNIISLNKIHTRKYLHLIIIDNFFVANLQACFVQRKKFVSRSQVAKESEATNRLYKYKVKLAFSSIDTVFFFFYQIVQLIDKLLQKSILAY